jgi:DNA-binding NarL/FixJ family response regulator
MECESFFISRNKLIFTWVEKVFNECGFKDVNFNTLEKNLNTQLNELKPKYVFIHSGFYSCVTPYMIGCLLENFPELNIIVVNFGNFTDSLAVRFIFHGAKSYIDFNDGIEEFKKGLNIIKTGQVYYSPGVDRQINLYDEIPKLTRENTDREWQVLFLICNGFKEEDIMANLTIGKRTVETHIYNLYKKFDVDNRNDLTRKAVYMGWVKKEHLCFYGSDIKIPKHPTRK